MSKWTARVEWQTPDTYDEGALDLLMGHLEGHDPAIALEHTFSRQAMKGGIPSFIDTHTYSATVTIEANTLRQAVAAALELVEGSTDQKATGIEVLDVATHDHRVEQPSIPELVGYAEIADLLGVSQQRARQLPDLAGFPAPVVVVRAGPLRVRSQVEGWAATWQRKVGRPRKATTS